MDIAPNSYDFFSPRRRWLAPELKEDKQNLRLRTTSTDTFAFACLCIEVSPFVTATYTLSS